MNSWVGDFRSIGPLNGKNEKVFIFAIFWGSGIDLPKVVTVNLNEHVLYNSYKGEKLTCWFIWPWRERERVDVF